jgi:tRNA (guanine37-N1)-methyltransferase
VRIDIVTIFPGMFVGPFEESMVRRARAAGIVDVHVHDLRDYTGDRHRTTDDAPYGGGAGMVMKPEPLFRAVEAITGGVEGAEIVLLTPQGQRLDQALVEELAGREWLVLLCGHYEGVDERVRAHLATREVSIGDYVLTGGELPAMVLVDAVVRLRPGVLGCADSAREESHSAGLLEYPQFTRPAEFRGWSVPEVLLSGHHAEIARWRRRQALRRTLERRSDLLARAGLSAEERELIREWSEEGASPLPLGEGTRVCPTLGGIAIIPDCSHRQRSGNGID